MNMSVQHFDSVNTLSYALETPNLFFLVNLLPSIIVINIIIIIVDVVLLLFLLL